MLYIVASLDYGSYFKALPEKYGMRYAHVSLSADSKNAQLLGEPCGYDLVCVAYFPTTSAFLASWSDSQVKTAFKKHRQQMVDLGFKHYWTRTSAVKD
jgi:hypothetical protein